MATGLSVIVGVIIIAIIIMLGRNTERAADYDFAAGKGILLEEAEDAFTETSSNEDLYRLLLGLCYQLKTNEQAEHIQMIRKYGTELYDRVKAGTLDLEQLDDNQEQTMDLIDMINDYGIKQ